MNKDAIQDYRELKRADVDVTKHNQIRYNSGSETTTHIVGKAIAGQVLTEAGYRVSSEVETERGEIDIVAFGLPERQSMAVEIETNATDDVVSSKLDRYVHSTPLDELYLIEATNLPDDIHGIKKHITEVLGL